MPIVDGRGHLLGRVNIVDAFVILLIIATTVAGGALLTAKAGPAGAGAAEATVTLQAAVPPYVLAAIEAGTVPADDVSAVTAVEALGTVERAEMDTAGVTTYHRVALTVTLDVSRGDGELAFRGEPLYVGREVSLDLGRTVIDGVIVDYAA